MEKTLAFFAPLQYYTQTTLTKVYEHCKDEKNAKVLFDFDIIPDLTQV